MTTLRANRNCFHFGSRSTEPRVVIKLCKYVKQDRRRRLRARQSGPSFAVCVARPDADNVLGCNSNCPPIAKTETCPGPWSPPADFAARLEACFMPPASAAKRLSAFGFRPRGRRVGKAYCPANRQSIEGPASCTDGKSRTPRSYRPALSALRPAYFACAPNSCSMRSS